jgi:aminopeptidase
MQDPRLERLADVIVNYSVAVRKGDLVRISGSPVACPLIVPLYRKVVEAGGNPFVRMAPEECTELMLKHGSDAQLSFINPLMLKEVEEINCSIGIWASENTKALSNTDPSRQAIVQKARRPILDVFFKRAAAKGKNKLRWSGTQYPTFANAQDAEMSLAEYEDFVYKAGLLHKADPAAEWKKVSKAQQKLCDFLNRARQVRFTTPQGTDIRMGVKGRKWINCDGHENFPDGEVFTGPIETATEGVVAFSFPAVHGGREVTDVVLRFKAGKVVDASASKGEDFLVKMLDSDAGARVLGELALGCNYSIQRFTKNTLFDEKIGGTFHLAVGAAYPESGGKNQSAVHWDMVCDLRRGGIVEVDGKVISRNGKFTRADWPK